MPHAEVKTPDQVLTEQEKQVLHLYDEQKWTLRRIGQELGVSLERARQCRRGALAKLDEVARLGDEALCLLPARAAKLVQFFDLGTRADVREAILTRRMYWSYWGNGLCLDGRRVRNAGWDTLAHLHAWARLPPPVHDSVAAPPEAHRRPWREQQTWDEMDARVRESRAT